MRGEHIHIFRDNHNLAFLVRHMLQERHKKKIKEAFRSAVIITYAGSIILRVRIGLKMQNVHYFDQAILCTPGNFSKKVQHKHD